MDKFFWGRDMEDVFDWTKGLQMVIKVKELDENKLFKIVKFNLKGKVQDWYYRLDPPHEDYRAL